MRNTGLQRLLRLDRDDHRPRRPRGRDGRLHIRGAADAAESLYSAPILALTKFVKAPLIAWTMALSPSERSPKFSAAVPRSVTANETVPTVVEELGWLSVLVADVLAVAGMGGWIWRRESFRAS